MIFCNLIQFYTILYNFIQFYTILYNFMQFYVIFVTNFSQKFLKIVSHLNILLNLLIMSYLRH